MYRIIDCIAQQHDYWLLAVATLVCIAGSLLTVLTLRRAITATGARKRAQLMLSSLVTGATIWTTHFISMLAYDPGVDHGYEPYLTAMSLGIAVVGALAANLIFAYGAHRNRHVGAGACFGLSVSIMHYIGMSAYQLPGDIIWRPGAVMTSLLLCVAIGIAAYHRMLHPVTRYCWLGGATLMVLAICAMHFTGMSAFEIHLDSRVIVPPQVFSDAVLGIFIFSVVMLILFIGFSAISIETNLEREAVDRLKYTVTHDHLTGLPNRLDLKQRVDDLSIALDHDPTKNVAVVSVDLDLFKEINDIHGHEVGDMVLMAVASRLRNVIGANEFISRVGGDEFIALKTDLSDAGDAMTFATAIRDCILPPIRIDTCTVVISVSLGIATSDNDGLDMDGLLRKSELAMFRAKEDPDINICQYDAEMDQKVREKMRMINDLRLALDGDQFQIVYQLQNETGTREPIGCEALLRWHHPDHGIISPAVFIPLAEETGLINDIGRWVLRTACIEAASWAKPWSVAVNVAPQQIAQPTFIDDLNAALRDSKLPPQRLELEVTEASVINDQAYALKVLKEVKKIGVRIAMDDFGTGYSSLATLQTFPFDKIKIDRSFVTDLHKNHQRAAIVRSTLSLGEALDIPVLAEGVETEDELTYLAEQGCRFVQGFYFGKPLHVDVIRRLTAVQIDTIAS